MSGNIRLYNSGGYVELQAPDNAESQTLILPTDSIQPALVHIATETFSAVSSVSFDDVFSSTYDNYRLTVVIDIGSTNSTEVDMRMRASGTDNTGANYSQNSLRIANGTAAAGSYATGQTAAQLYLSDEDNVGVFSGDVFNPYLAKVTSITGIGGYFQATPQTYIQNAVHTSTSSYDGITFITNSGTITGTIRIYGYRNS